MTEGTKSVLFGAHSIIHSIMVYIAWYKLYGKFPSFKETVCILLHDIGYIGKNYLTDKSNDGHAELGANICGYLFGEEYKNLCLGHSSSAQKKYNIEPSKLEKPDEYCWVIAPLIWMKWNNYIEKFGVDPALWKSVITKKLETGNTESGTTTFQRILKEQSEKHHE